MPANRTDRHSAEGRALQDHLVAAEGALRQVAAAAGSEGERTTAERHADVVAQIRRDFRGRPLSEGAVTSAELVDALLAGTEALRLQAASERQAAARAPQGDRQRAEREARAAECDRQADRILELDREVEL